MQTTNEIAEPNNIEAEQQVLGALFNDNSLLDRVSDILKVEHFYEGLHGRVYESSVARIAKSDLVNPITLKVEFENDPALKSLGGAGYFVRCQGAAISISQIRDYAFLIIDAWTRRQLLDTTREGIKRLYDGDETTEVRNDMEASFATLTVASDQTPFMSLGQSVVSSVKSISSAYRDGVDPGISTGYPSLDNILGGLAKGDMMTLAGTTSMGKTTVGLAICEKIAQRGQAVAIISREMSADSLASRLMSKESKVPYQSMRRASQLSEAQVRDIVKSSISVADLPVFIVPPYVRDIVAIHGAVRAIKAECAKRGLELGLVMVDYLQLVHAPGKTTVERVGNASMGIKGIATQVDVPVISLAQLSRSISSREDRRPQLSDIKDSSQIEQDSDQVVFCHREEYWLERDGKPKSSAPVEVWNDYDTALKACAGQVELIVAKNRHGALGTAKLKLDAATNTMTETYGNDPYQKDIGFA